MIIIEEKDVREILQPKQAVGLMRQALLGLTNGQCGQPGRLITQMPNGAAFGFMPAWIGQAYFGAKVISAYAPNLAAGYPSHLGYVMLFEAQHCTVTALVDASSITEIRTGAVSAVATDLLARVDAHTLALIGTGAQARSHLAAIREVRDIQSVNVYDLRKQNALRFKKETEGLYGIPVTVCGAVRDTVSDADIICTLTPATEPFLYADMVSPGTHINAVGTFTPVTREVSTDLVVASRLYADQVEAMQKESGEYGIPLSEGRITDKHIVGSIGQILGKQIPGRQNKQEITLFDALGLAVEDVLSAGYVYEKYTKKGGKSGV